MAIYRIHRDLAKGNTHIAAGSLCSLDGMGEAAIDKLVSLGIISRIAPPPLSEIPGWATRAARLKTVGIIDVEEFLEADAALLAKTLKVRVSTIEDWREQIRAAMQTSQAAG